MSLRTLLGLTLNAGLMKPRRGFIPVAGKQKLGVGKAPLTGSIPKAQKQNRLFR